MSSPHLHLDFETYAPIDLKKVGAYRYAAEAEILCAAMAFDDEEPVVWYPGVEESEPFNARVCTPWQKYWDALEDPEVLIYAFAATFEMAISQALLEKTWGIKCPALSRFRCVQSLARRAALPAKLDKLAEVLGLHHQKDTRGKSLINKFSKMQSPKKPTKKFPEGRPARRILPSEEPEAFAEFCQYCAGDVLSEREAAHRLAYFDEDHNNRNYSLDAQINARGVPVNLSALRHAQQLINEESTIVSAKFRHITGFECTQNAKLLEWCRANGFEFPNLKADTLDEWLEEQEGKIGQSGIVEEALRLKQSVAYASIKKVKAMILCAGPDSRVRGTHNHHGATTGRWTHSLVQPGNFKRPAIKGTEDAYRMICEGCSREMLELCYGSVLEVISSSIRHFIQDAPRNIYDGDYAGVEARIVAWLAGQEDALERFRAYDKAPTGSPEKKALDPYRIMASDVYNIPVSAVQPFPHRFIGKGLVLGAGFMLSPKGFRRQCVEQAKYDLPVGQEDHAIGLWRRKHKKIVQWWKDLDNAGKSAVLHHNKIFPAGKVSFCCKTIEGTLFLLMKLPSGRNLAYPRPRIIPGKFEGTTQIEYFGLIKGTKWGACRLWPGVMANNATQGTANDVMFVGAHNCEREGYQIFSIVHDQALAFIREGQTAERFTELLTDMPPWCAGLPLASEGGEAPFYRKS